MLLVKVPKEGILMEKIKLTKPETMPMPQPQAPLTNLPMAHHHHHHMHKQANQSVDKKVTKSYCESHMHRYVEIQAVDGYCYDGIVEHVDEEWICLAVPGPVDQLRGLFPPPLYPPFGPYRPRRFNRLILPLAALVTISLLPYYW
jgi:hypothetical protein